LSRWRESVTSSYDLIIIAYTPRMPIVNTIVAIITSTKVKARRMRQRNRERSPAGRCEVLGRNKT